MISLEISSTVDSSLHKFTWSSLRTNPSATLEVIHTETGNIEQIVFSIEDLYMVHSSLEKMIEFVEKTRLTLAAREYHDRTMDSVRSGECDY